MPAMPTRCRGWRSSRCRGSRPPPAPAIRGRRSTRPPPPATGSGKSSSGPGPRLPDQAQESRLDRRLGQQSRSLLPAPAREHRLEHRRRLLFDRAERPHHLAGGVETAQRIERDLDLRVDRIWKFQRWTLSAYLDISNAYLNAAAIDYQYNFDYSRRTAITRPQQPRWLY